MLSTTTVDVKGMELGQRSVIFDANVLLHDFATVFHSCIMVN